MHLSTLIPMILVNQVGTDFVVRSGRSPARYQQLAWITVMVLGSLITGGWMLMLREPAVVLTVGVSPFLIVTACLLLSDSDDAGHDGAPKGSTPSVATTSYVDMSYALQFVLFATNGSTGEALNDMATELKTRAALQTGDTSLQLAYNIAVILSMLLGYVLESLVHSDGARKVFILVWSGCQAMRGIGMEFMTPDRLWVVFLFVFCDKFSGPLGQAAIDTALLKLISRGSEDTKGNKPKSWRVIPANGLWTYRNAVSSLERPLCGLVLMSLQLANAPLWLPMALASLACGFVLVTL